MADGTVSLRCKHCGAPLDSAQLKSDSPYVTCDYCGTSQQRIDAEKYMADMVNESFKRMDGTQGGNHPSVLNVKSKINVLRTWAKDDPRWLAAADEAEARLP